jgi:hypothetical protein
MSAPLDCWEVGGTLTIYKINLFIFCEQMNACCSRVVLLTFARLSVLPLIS